MLKKALVGALEVLGKRWESIGKALEKCWNLPVEWKSISVRFPVRGHMFYCSVSGCMQVLMTYLPRQALILVLSAERLTQTDCSHEDISRAGFENNFDMEAIFGEIIY